MITIRALTDFHAGPRAANGSRDVAIHKGETRRIADVGPGGAFWTVTKWGTRFDRLCRLGVDHGWERVSVAARPRTVAPAGRPAQAVSAGSALFAPVGVLGSAASREGEGEADDWDEWPI